MTQPPFTHPALAALRRPVAITRAGMLAERITRGFWPVWTVLLGVMGALMLGLQDTAPLELVWGAAVISVAALVWFGWRGWRAFRWPTRADALARLDATLPGRPIETLGDTQAIGTGDAASEAVWQAHLARMAARIQAARAVRPDLRISARDPYALRYAAVLLFAVALLFGSLLRVASVADMAPGGGQAQAAGPAWEGWIEPPRYTGKPSLYLADIPGESLSVPQGSRITLRLYGAAGALAVEETVSGRTPDADAPAQDQIAQSFDVTRSGRIDIKGPGGRAWSLVMQPDAAPSVNSTQPAERKADGELRQPFAARDDHGVTEGQAVITLDLAALNRRHGLTIAPDPRDQIMLDLPVPFRGDRANFEEVLVDDFSKHPWANLPVTIRLQVSDALGQTGASDVIHENLGGLRFFDPMAKAIIEQRRDLLWAKGNAKRVAQILRAVSYSPKDIFRSETVYLKLRVAIRQLEAGFAAGPLSTEAQDEIAEALWVIAEQLEYGDMADALERLRRAQERLSEAIKNGASDEEIASLMDEMREAMQDYMRQLAENAERNGEDQQQAQGEMQEITGDQLQEMMDRIQELMEQGRMAEAQELLDQLQQMMENMQIAQGQQGGQGQQGQQGQGNESMQDMQEALRDQQGLSDEAFRDLQEKYNEGARPGESQGNSGDQDDQGRGRSDQDQPDQQQGQGQGQGDTPEGQQGTGQSLADRQQALRDELNRQEGKLPGAGTPEGDAAREALGRAGNAMEGAEKALRDGDHAEALDRQSDAMEALREGIRNMGEALAGQQRQQNGQGQAGTPGDPQGRQRDPLGREAGSQGQLGSDEQFLQGDDVYRRAGELLDELRRRSGERERSDQELEYLKRLLDRF